MALRALQGPAGGTAPVGGSGNPNTIPRWTGATTLGDSGLIDDGSQIYTTSRVLAVNTATTLGTGLIRFQVGSASSLANYQGAQAGFMLPTGSGSWVEFCENSASGTTFRISKDASTGVVLNANGKNLGFNASGYTTAVANSQMVLLTNGNVGIGTPTPGAQFQVERAGGTVANAEYIRLRNLTNGTGSNVTIGMFVANNSVGTGYISHVNAAGPSYDTTFSNWNGSTAAETLRIVGSTGSVVLGSATGATIQAAGSQQGLKLPATPGNTDPNTIDCYADGGTANSGGVTWTPTVTFGGASTGITYQSRVGRYTRVGNMVFATCYVALTSKGSATGNVKITGLPTSSNTTDLYAGAALGYFANITSTGQLMGYLPANDTGILLNQTTAAGVSTVLTDAAFANNAAFILTIAYPVT